MANQPKPTTAESEEQFDMSTATASVSVAFLVLCPETSSNYPYAHRAEFLSNFRKENTSLPAAETPVTAKSEIMMDASAKARSPSVSSNRSSSSSSTATAAQTPRFLKVCPVHYGRGDGPDDFSLA